MYVTFDLHSNNEVKYIHVMYKEIVFFFRNCSLLVYLGTRSKYNKKGFASAASNIRNPRDVNKKNTEICEKDKMAEGGKRNSSPV